MTVSRVAGKALPKQTAGIKLRLEYAAKSNWFVYLHRYVRLQSEVLLSTAQTTWSLKRLICPGVVEIVDI